MNPFNQTGREILGKAVPESTATMHQSILAVELPPRWLWGVQLTFPQLPRQELVAGTDAAHPSNPLLRSPISWTSTL